MLLILAREKEQKNKGGGDVKRLTFLTYIRIHNVYVHDISPDEGALPLDKEIHEVKF